MKKLVLASVLFAILAYVNADRSSSFEEDFKEIMNLLEEKINITVLSNFIVLGNKIRSKSLDIGEKMNTVEDQIEECIEEIDFRDETICSLLRKNLKKCSKPAIDLISYFLQENSKDFSSMVEKIIVVMVEQTCQSTVEEILELFNPCFMRRNFIDFQPCVEIKTSLDEFRHQVSYKSFFCSIIPKMRNCMKEHLQASCQNSITRRSSLKFQDAVWNSVKDDCKA
ncbi:uncharacterized protein LOC130452869 isoform X1 [Diorhabda sublineata]|uniref:uncharacterized protein LOC130452869 isoform X1 n=2 Tax=Diorhabda sublineata TaxID=1163346 RepID=UPI0024E088FB|nr:uncharacterized protein LOC130452869 isoform X1 [Diorhabda sublineata]